jgi:hypothetical protein
MTPPLLYEHCDIPPGMTCAEYRRHVDAEQSTGRQRGIFGHVLRLLGLDTRIS